jgi:hypothetical protein
MSMQRTGKRDAGALEAMPTASASAVASSRSDAEATGRPVSSATSVWKWNSISRRPWLISDW